MGGGGVKRLCVKKIKKGGALGDFYYFETEVKNPLKTQNFK